MSYEKVRQFLTTAGYGHKLVEHPVSTATVGLAAAAIGCQSAQIAKSLTFKNKDGGAILIVTAGDGKINNSKFKNQFGYKAKMLTPEEVALYVNHPIGGVCPFAVPEDLPIYLDISLQRFTTIYPAAGAPNATLEISCHDLFTLSKAKAWIDVCTWQK